MARIPRVFLLAALIVVAGATRCPATDTDASSATAAGVQAVPLPDGLYAIWRTRHGPITAELHFQSLALTVANFVGLAEGTIPFKATRREPGQPFYDGLTFHRVVPGFVVQGGDPEGNGEGGPGYEFADEFSPHLKHDRAGILAMANAGPNTNGCQFYFTLSAVNRLNYMHTVFGRVIRGFEVLPRIEQGDAMDHIEIVRVGAVADAFRPDAEMFARLRETTPTIASRDPALPALFEDTAGLELPEGFPEWLNNKLNNYAAVSGVTIRVRSMPKFKIGTDAGVDVPRNPLRALHEQLSGNDPDTATIVFLAEENRWRLWLGEGLLPRFDLAVEASGSTNGRPNLHELKQSILAEARAQMEAGIPRRSVDAAVTGLVEALDRPEGMTMKASVP